MATPPFNIAETTPADNSYASVFPAAERTFRDVVESWLLIEHNTYGRHDQVSLDEQTSLSGEDAILKVWADSGEGKLKSIYGSGGSEEYVGVPPGTVLDFAGATAPNGYLLCYGQAISRTTYAALFTAIGTAHGNGDGSTTFNLPDCRGRAVAGKDDMGGTTAGRITAAGSGVTGTTLGAAGGADTHTLTVAQIPTGTHTYSFSDPGHTHTYIYRSNSGLGVASPGSVPANTASHDSGSSTTGITSTLTDNCGGQAHTNLQPTIIMNKVIKY